MDGEGNCGFESCDFDVDRISARRLSEVRSAVAAVLFTALVFTVGESRARGRDYDPPLWSLINSPTSSDRGLGDDPTRDDTGGWCDPAGCYIWADAWDDPTGGIGGGGGPGGGGSGGTGSSSGGSGPPPPPPALPPASLPDRDKLQCAARAYGKFTPRYPWVIDNIWAFFKEGANELFSTMTPIPPPGYEPDDGVTNEGPDWPYGGQTILFASGVSAHPDGFFYEDSKTKTRVVVPGPFTSFEWALVTYAHEVAHQSGVDDEGDAESYGVAALQAYRADHGDACR